MYLSVSNVSNIIYLYLYPRISNEALGLIKTQIEVKEKNVQFILRKSVSHGIFNLTLSIIQCFCGHTDKRSFTISCCSIGRNL